MKTRIIYTAEDNSYSQCIEELDYECTAQEYIDGCKMNDSEYPANETGAFITAKVYAENADPMFDEPISTTTAEIA